MTISHQKSQEKNQCEELKRIHLYIGNAIDSSLTLVDLKTFCVMFFYVIHTNMKRVLTKISGNSKFHSDHCFYVYLYLISY